MARRRVRPSRLKFCGRRFDPRRLPRDAYEQEARRRAIEDGADTLVIFVLLNTSSQPRLSDGSSIAGVGLEPTTPAL